jgi:predicted amidohydrolase YtcJ
MERSFLFHGGRVHQGAGRTPADWALVKDGVVHSVGQGAAPAAPGASPWDLRGAALLPAFCDAHVHLAWIATSFLGCDLGAAQSAEELLAALAAWSGPGRGPRGEWRVGYGFDESGWKQARLPTRAELDAVAGARPALVQRVCGHVGVVNSAALAQLRPGSHTDAASGRLAEDDLYAVNDLLRPGPELLAEALPRVVATLHQHGITAVQDVSSPEMLAALQKVGALGLQVTCAMPTRFLHSPVGRGSAARGDSEAYFAARGLAGMPLGENQNPRVLGLKLFLDGSLGARTAYLREPYTDAPEMRGAALFGREELAALAGEADAAGLQLMVHAIGDAALDRALEVLTPLVRGGNPLRHRIEHAEVTPEDLVRRLAMSGVHVCAQPNFARRWSGPRGMNEQRLGPRLGHCNAYRALQEGGVQLAFGSDCMPLGPLFGVRGAVLHPVAAERLDAARALDLYSVASRALVSGETPLWGIVPGGAADLVVLDPDPMGLGRGLPGGGASSVPPVSNSDSSDPWDRVRVAATFVAGRLVHTAAG